MVSPAPATEFKNAFAKRTKQARIAAGYSQEDMATLLGMDQPKYSKYEKRSLLPHRYVEPFCLAARIEERWLFTGKGRGPAVIPADSARATRKSRSGEKAA